LSPNAALFHPATARRKPALIAREATVWKRRTFILL